MRHLRAGMGHVRPVMGHEPGPGGRGGRWVRPPRRFTYSAGVASPSSGSASGWMPAAIFSTWLSG